MIHALTINQDNGLNYWLSPKKNINDLEEHIYKYVKKDCFISFYKLKNKKLRFIKHCNYILSDHHLFNQLKKES